MIGYLIGVFSIIYALTIGYYEGIPLVRDIPGLSSVPILGDIGAGRVNVEADRRVSAATKDLVQGSELAVANDTIQRLKRESEDNARAAMAARLEAQAAQADADTRGAQTEKNIADDTSADSGHWTAHDIEQLHINRRAP